MEFNRKFNFRAELVSETVSKQVFHYVQQQIESYKDNFEHEKRNRPVCMLWSRRMHLALRAYQELLNTLSQWPPDIFALTSTLFALSGCYRLIFSPRAGKTWPPT